MIKFYKSARLLRCKLLLLVLFATFAARQGFSQTTLASGDLAFTAFYSSPASPSPDEFAFILLAPIANGTSINFTDIGYNSITASHPQSAVLDATIRWTCSGLISALTEVQIIGTTAYINGVVNGTVTVVENNGVGLTLSSAGDCILAYQGTAAPATTPTFIAGIQMNYEFGPPASTAATWDPLGQAPANYTYSNSRSALPPGLNSSNSMWVGTEYDNGKFNCAVLPQSSIANLRSAIFNPANWIFNDVAQSSGWGKAGCTSWIGSPISLTISSTNVSCNGGNNGTASVSVSGGTSPYTYSWSPSGGTNATATGRSAGTYTVTVTDATSSIATGFVTVTQPSAFSVTTAQANVSCHGGSNGAAAVAVSGATAPYTYSWSPSGGTNATASGRPAGTYTNTITDANGCQTTRSFTLTQPSSPITPSTTVTNVTCYGGSNGAIDLSVSGGTAPYTYNWGSSITTQDRTNLSAGSYTVAITDNNGCMTTTTSTVTQPAFLGLPFTEGFESTTFPPTGWTRLSMDSPDGSTWNVDGIKQWERRTTAGITGSTNSAAMNFYAYPYYDKDQLTGPVVSLSGYSSSSLSFKVAYRNYPNAANYDTLRVFISTDCGTTWGSAIYTKSGSTLATSGSSSTAFAPTSAADWRTETVNLSAYAGSTIMLRFITSSAYGNNLYLDDISITGSNAPVAAFTGSPLSGCSSLQVQFTDQSTGSPTSWAWDIDNNGTTDYTTQNPSHTYSTPGTYSAKLIVTNGSGSNTLTKTNYITVTGITTNQSQVNVSCNGVCNGSATVTPTSGTAPFTYSWAPSGGTGATANNLCAGTYTVTVTDANGCTASRIFSITQPASPLSSTFVTTNVSCFGGSNGTIDLTPTGGTSPYTYSWGGGVTTQDRSGLMAGSYTVIITDAGGCISSRTMSISQPTAPVSGTTVVTNVACFGGSNGAINLTPSGGTGPYTYNWLPSGPTTEDRTGLVAGTYTVVITDANACTGTVTVSITQPSAPVSGTTVVTNVACFGGSNGAINLTPSGGTGPYTYNWLPSGPTTEDRTGLEAGTYTVVITDANSCTGTVTTSVTQPTAPVSGSTVVTNVACFGGSNGAINLSPSGGTGPYTYNWLPSGPTTEDRTGLVAGTYTVFITDANACTGTVTTSVTQPTSPVSGSTVVTNVACFGGSNGAINLTPSGGTGPYTYNWLPSGPTTEDRTALTSGTYTVVITDANSCTGTVTTSVTQPTTPVSASTVVTNVACFGGSNGAINLTPSGGTGPYTYNWLPSGPTTEDRTSLVAGSYTVVITDANGCTGTVTTSVNQPTSPVSGTTVVTNVACYGESNGAINLTPAGGTGPYTFNWGSGITTEDRTSLAAGNYSVVITDANGCTGSVTASVTEPALLQIMVEQSATDICPGGSVALTASEVDAALYFNGSGQHINLPSFSFNSNGGPITIEFWAKINSSDVGNHTLFDFPTADGLRVLAHIPWGDNTLYWDYGNISGNGRIFTDYSAYLNKWTHVALVSEGINGSFKAIYLDGVLVASANISDGANTTGQTGLNLGTSSISSTFKGAIDEFRVWNQVRSSSQIQSNMNGSVAATSGLILNLPLDETSGTIIQDYSSNGFSGTLVQDGNGDSPTRIQRTYDAQLTYNWSPASGLSATIGAIVSASPSSTTVYTVTGTNGSCSATSTATVTVISAPQVTVTTSSTCAGSANGTASAVVTGGSGPYAYSWAPSGGNSAIASGLAAGSYTVTATGAYGCTASAVVNITADTSDVPTVTDAARCGQGVVTLNATGTGTITWYSSATGGSPVHTGNTYSPTVSATTTYYVSNVSGGGTGNVGMTAPTTGAQQTSTNYLIFDVFDQATLQGVYVYPGAAGNVVLVLYNSSGAIITSASVAVGASDVNQRTYIPLNFSLTPGTGFRLGQGPGSVSMFRNEFGVSYPYTLPGVLSITGSAAGGDYYYFSYDWVVSSGCASQRVPVTATVNPAPAISVTSSAGGNICSGNSSSLTASSSNSAYSYTWSPTTGLSSSTGAVVTASPSATTTYTVTANDAAGCTTVETIAISVTQSPVIAATSLPNSVCSGATIQLDVINSTPPTVITIGTGTITNSNTSYPAPYGNYYWGARHQFLVTAAELTAAGLQAGQIKSLAFNVANVNGAQPHTNFTIRIGTTSLSSVTGFESGLTQVYSAASHAPVLGWNTHTFTTPFTWNGTDNLIVETCFNNNSYDGNASVYQSSTSFTSTVYYYQDAFGVCGNSTVNGTSNQRPNMQFGQVENVAYSWLPATSVSNPNVVNPTATPTVTTTYSVTATGVNGCTTTDTTIVTVNTFAPAATSNSPVAPGNTIQLSASGGNSYTWTGPNGFTSFDQNPQIANATAAEAGVYTIIAVSALGCTSTEYITVSVGNTHYLTINQNQPASSTNFTSFAAAATYLNTTGVANPTVINVVSGTGPYTGKLLLQSVPGSSATNTLTINGNGNTLTGCFGPFNGNRDMIRLDGTDHITINGFVLDGSACGDLWGVHLLNGNENVTISNNTILHNPAYSIYGANHQGIIAANSFTATGAMAGVLNNLTITGNTIHHGYAAIRINGSSSDWANNVVISNNTLTGAALNGIVTSYTNNLSVTGNQLNLRNVHPAQDIHSIGIQISYSENGLAVTGNKVANAGKQALFLNYVNEQSTTRGLIANNMLGGGMRFSSPIAMQLNYANYLDVYFNSLNADFGTGIGLYVSNVKSRNLRVMNNSIAYTGASATGRAMSASGGFVNFTQLNYNNYYSTGQFVWFNNALRNNLTQLRASMENGTITHDQQSTAANPQYVSATDLHLSASSFLQGMGTAINGIATDFDGQTRPSVPSIGADEYTAPPRMAQAAQTEGEVYPNPFRTTLTVAMEQAEGAATIKLVDMMGRRVYQSTANFAEGKVSLNPEVAQGVYLLQVTNKGVTYQFRVVKQ